MKQNNTIIAVIVLIIIVGGLLFFNQNKKIQTNKQDITTETKPGVFESIRDAMSRSMSLKCEYKTVDSQTVAYVKGKMVRVDGIYKNTNKNSTILKNDKMWTWDVVKKEGMIITLKQTEENKASTSDELINDLEKQKQFCKPTIVADSMFNPPTDVKFQDLSGMIENLQNTKQ